jgi:hypothetical protein
LVAFSDDEEGNKKAEEFFRSLLTKNYGEPEVPEDVFESSLDDGYWDGKRGYTLFIVHSSNPTDENEASEPS